MAIHRHRAVTSGSAAAVRWLVLTLCFAAFLLSALQTLVVPVVGDIGRSLGTSADATSWVVTSNLLAAAVGTPVLGRLADVRGRRPVLLGVLAAVLAGSLIAAAAHSLALLLAGRVLQGAGYGVFPIAVALVRDEIPAERGARAMAGISGMLSVGGGVALAATGLLTRHGGDYRRVFWLAAGLTAVAFVLAWLAVPARRPEADGRVDWRGAAVLAVALVLLLTPLSQGNRWGWRSPGTVAGLTGAAVMFGVFLLLERATPHALIAPGMFRRPPIVVANIAGLVLGLSNFTGLLGVTALVQTPREPAGYGFGATVLSTSLVYLLPGALSGLVTAPLGGELLHRLGARATLALSMLLSTVAFTALAFFHEASWQVVLATAGTFIAVLLGYAALPALLGEHVSPADTGIVNSVNSVARTVGSALASALLVALLTRDHIPGLPVAVPRDHQYTVVFLTGAGATSFCALLVALRPGTAGPARVRAARSWRSGKALLDPALDTRRTPETDRCRTR